MKKIEKLLKKLKERNMQGFFVESKKEAVEKVLSLIDKQKEIGFGWSTTNFEIGLIDALRIGGYNILDRFEITDRCEEKGNFDELINILNKSQSSDIFITGTNAITEDGVIVNSDSMGTRVAPMIYGPEKVIIIVGINKIVKNKELAVERINKIAALKNAERKNLDFTDERVMAKLCSYTTFIEFQPRKDRIKVIIIAGEYGF